MSLSDLTTSRQTLGDLNLNNRATVEVETREAAVGKSNWPCSSHRNCQPGAKRDARTKTDLSGLQSTRVGKRQEDYRAKPPAAKKRGREFFQKPSTPETKDNFDFF